MFLLTRSIIIGCHLSLVTLLLFLPAFTVVAATEKPAKYGMEIRPAWITMPDGVRLSADLYLPTGGAAGEKFPVLLEYLPYRKHEARGRDWRAVFLFRRSAVTSSRRSTSAAPATAKAG